MSRKRRSICNRDRLEDNIAVAAELARKAGQENAKFISAGIYNPDLEPESLDVSYSRWLMVHLSRPVDAMRAIQPNTAMPEKTGFSVTRPNRAHPGGTEKATSQACFPSPHGTRHGENSPNVYVGWRVLLPMSLERSANRDALPTLFRILAVLMISIISAAVAYAQSIAGTWQGILPVGQSTRIVLRITDAANGALRGSIRFIDRSDDAVPLLLTTYIAPNLTAGISDITFRGKLSVDGKSIAGTWTQDNQSSPMSFARATPDTLWTSSRPSTMPAMPATADPSFEVATIKPSAHDANWGISSGTRLFQARGNTVVDLIQFAYQVRRRQIDSGPSWMNELRFDVTGGPDAPGLPSVDQERLMLRKLLADRFGFRVHIVQRDFPVYALVVDKSPPNISVSAPSVNTILISPRELEDGNTAVQFSHTNMPEFADFLMGWIQDRQIVDETRLNGRFDFTVMVSTSSVQGGNDNDNATAFLLGIKPLGFRLVPKTEPLKVIVIENVDKPTPD